MFAAGRSSTSRTARLAQQRALLSLVFHPRYESNRLFYVNYTWT